MNKQTLSYFFILLALFIGAIVYSSTLQSPFITALNTIKTSYYKSTDYLESTIEKHFFQAQKIEDLEHALRNYQQLHVQISQYKSELNSLFKENNSTFSCNPQVELVRTVSYQKFGDFNRLWMDIPDYNSSKKIYGLLYNEYVAGIIIDVNNKPLALLNRDIKSTYSVYVGDEKAPGITHGNNDKNIIVSFIPAWSKINVGDEVETSGLDDIFFKGLKVGKVLSVTKSRGYQNAIIQPYFESNEPSYFYMIKRVK